MVKKAGEILTSLFVGFALGFWVAAMATNGWLIVHVHKVAYYHYLLGRQKEVSMNR